GYEYAATVHRFFAVSFDTVYYKRVTCGHLIQCALLLALPGIPYFGPCPVISCQNDV
ncbi:unnamed protein product, partial [Mesorhabditis belari]